MSHLGGFAGRCFVANSCNGSVRDVDGAASLHVVVPAALLPGTYPVQVTAGDRSACGTITVPPSIVIPPIEWCSGGPSTRPTLLRRGPFLEFATLAWNVVGVVVRTIAALAARSVALAGFGPDSLIETF